MIDALSPVLIANRGEIAVRVAGTVRRLGLRSVAVFSDADAGAPHVRAADDAVRIGPADARSSYLSIDALLDAAHVAGARSVHPGYGFLAESAAFARAVTDAGLVWIGPPPAAIEPMGDKARAKTLAREAGVPVVPGLEAAGGGDLGLDEIAAFCAEHGFPIVIKAVAGGGGKGMRVVRTDAELRAALDAARREAAAAFGDDRVLVERYLERPRHIEVQVLADAHGGVVHLGERECSLQRRHQKVVEEAPSPVVDAALRERMGEAAVQLARACGYVGAGTVELIVPGGTGEAAGAQSGTPVAGGATDADAASVAAGEIPTEFFFLEMNTRLQVEHPVTELVYGVDLVEQQLRAAAGEPLALAQDELTPRGHAVEARLYAEDPAAGFLPSTGVVRRWREPAGEGVRVDAALAEGLAVETHYDPMLAKLIAHGPDRATALARLQRALAETELLGVATNAAFTHALLARDDVRAVAIDTGLLERVLAGSSEASCPGDADGPLNGTVTVLDDLLPAAALTLRLLDADALARRTSVPLGWRASAAPAAWRRRVACDGRPVELAVRGDEVRVGGAAGVSGAAGASGAAGGAGPSGAVGSAGANGTAGAERVWRGSAVHAADGAVAVTLDGRTRRYVVARDEATGELWIGRDGHQLALAPSRAGGGDLAAADDSLAAPMPGRVLLVNVSDGDRVAAGDVLVVMESMKMELSVTAPHDGVVDGLAVAPGDRVALREVLVLVHPETNEAGGASSAVEEASTR